MNVIPLALQKETNGIKTCTSLEITAVITGEQPKTAFFKISYVAFRDVK